MLTVLPPVRALIRPDRAFKSWRPSLQLAVAAVVMLALVNAVGVYVGAGAIEAAVSGSVAVDNPARPSDQMCEMHEDGGLSDFSMADSITEVCQNEPRMIQQPLGPVAGDAASELSLAAGIGTLVWWLCIAAVFALFVTPENRGDFSELLAVAGWGLLPAAVRYAARPVLVARAAESWSHPTMIDTLQPAARGFVIGADTVLFGGVVAVTLLWQAVIYTYALSAAESVSVQRAAVVAGGLAVVPACLGLDGVGLPPANVAAISLLLVGIGVPSVVLPYQLTRLSEQFDAIGSTRRLRGVEPAAWNVWLTRAFGTAMLIAAVWLLGGPLLV